MTTKTTSVVYEIPSISSSSPWITTSGPTSYGREDYNVNIDTRVVDTMAMIIIRQRLSEIYTKHPEIDDEKLQSMIDSGDNEMIEYAYTLLRKYDGGNYLVSLLDNLRLDTSYHLAALVMEYYQQNGRKNLLRR